MGLERRVADKGLDVSVPRGGADQYIKSEKIEQHELNAFDLAERVLNNVYDNKLWYVLCKIVFLQKLQYLPVKIRTYVQNQRQKLVPVYLLIERRIFKLLRHYLFAGVVRSVDIKLCLAESFVARRLDYHPCVR